VISSSQFLRSWINFSNVGLVEIFEAETRSGGKLQERSCEGLGKTFSLLIVDPPCGLPITQADLRSEKVFT
jgi:hypothetical protein